MAVAPKTTPTSGGVKVARIMALVQLALRLTSGAVDPPAPTHGQGVVQYCRHRVGFGSQVFVSGQTLVQNIELALDRHRIRVDGVFDPGRRIRVEVAKTRHPDWG